MTEALDSVVGGAWVCADCGHANPPRDGVSALTCEACGLARTGVLEPPLDLPQRPALHEVPGFWYALGWSVLVLLGTVLLLSDSARAVVGLGRQWVLLEMVGAAYAAGSSLLAALWDRWFNEVKLSVPERARTGDEFKVELTLVPYLRLDDVSVSLTLLDRFYERSGDSGVSARVHRLGSMRPLTNGTLLGRRKATFESRFIAPFPARRHTDVRAEIAADVLDFVGVLVPAAKWNARNLREHGGYVVEAVVRVGWVPRRMVRRVFIYYIGDQVHFG